jgi:hypothetical protein
MCLKLVSIDLKLVSNDEHTLIFKLYLKEDGLFQHKHWNMGILTALSHVYFDISSPSETF